MLFPSHIASRADNPVKDIEKHSSLQQKGFEGSSSCVSFNWIGTVPSCANNELLNNVLRGEWGFVGIGRNRL